ncbi:TPA: hypothetical protein N2902_000960 [Vibrio parahaemolyticus]|uniref:hypothetical protein n=2 Tax=Vibrio parahaemolyticus TaxID=670 RepID=UPI00111E7904|nr:hypothetical protein [Vibrio parahaemolyticus]EJG0948711.1 hypothetical protein [Vibrio parahaemolyticus O1:K58]EGR2272137.1 hypothetical protein [Vibrio parahaemolyticus]EHH1095133.1 hypothetical protein [Vibrio parahaemolyticus]EHK2874679.1 hypothetical protein [Vibrio parahaemolyticus]EHK2923980.1 hypothetical protein [Vibrio parahaemolyticus]
MTQHGIDTAPFVITDLEEAVTKGRQMLPKLRRRWMCKYGGLRTDTPTCTAQQREKFKKLKAEYLKMLNNLPLPAYD